MSVLVHCNGPACDNTRDPGYQIRALCEGGWLRVSQGEGARTLDFCSHDCLTAWTAASGQTTRTEVDGR
jgi:hypothetical protein